MNIERAFKAALTVLVVPVAGTLAGCATNGTASYSGSNLDSGDSHSRNDWRASECFFIAGGQDGVKFDLGDSTYWVHSNGIVNGTASLQMHGEKGFSAFGVRASNLTTSFDVDVSVGPQGVYKHVDGRQTALSPSVSAQEIDLAGSIAWNELSHMRAGAPVRVCSSGDGFYGSGYGYAHIGGGMLINGVNDGVDNQSLYGTRPRASYSSLSYSLN